MRATLEWLKRHPILTSLLVIILFALPLVSVHFLFKWHSNLWFIEAEWESGDVLSYIAGFESLIGTIILSFLALWQNMRFKEENDRKDDFLLHVENEKIRLSYLPQFLIQSVDPERCIEKHYVLSKKYSEYVPLKKFYSYIFLVRKNGMEWLPDDQYPILKKGDEQRIVSIVNCGNNTAHQVKLSIQVKDKTYECGKASSIQKDNEIYFYLSIPQNVKLTEEMMLIIRYFDCFQNVYIQKFTIKEDKNCIQLISYSDVELIKRNSSMDLLRE